MKELSTKTVEVLRDALHVMEQARTGAVRKRAHFTRSEVYDAIDELDHTKTSLNVHDVSKVIDTTICARSIYVVATEWYADTDTIRSMVDERSLVEYRAAVQRLGIPVGGENQ